MSIQVSDNIVLTSECPFCHQPNEPIIVTREVGTAFLEGNLQAIEVTNGDKDKAEMLITGICVKCWDAMFGAYGGPEELDEN